MRDRTRGIDVRPVLAEPVARSIGTEHRFGRDELDPGQHRRALLALAVQLGARLRAEAQVADRLTLTVRYADGQTTTRSRVLSEAAAHTALVTQAAYGLYHSLGLQRARVRGLVL